MLAIRRFTFNPFEENTYILYNNDGDCCIIDPGCYTPDEQKQLHDFINTNDLHPVYLLNTHCHLDHIFGNTFVSETWKLPLHLHKKELPVLEFAPASAAMYGLPPFKTDAMEMIFLEEYDQIKIGNDILKILFTPGHSPGSISFYNEADEYVISGDALFSGSVGRTDLPGGDFQQLEQSIKTRLYTLPEITKVHPGHGGGTSISFEKKNNPFVRED